MGGWVSLSADERLLFLYLMNRLFLQKRTDIVDDVLNSGQRGSGVEHNTSIAAKILDLHSCEIYRVVIKILKKKMVEI